MIEVYIKMDTDSTNGVYRMWVDGQLIVDNSSVNYSNGSNVTRAGVKWFDFNNNQGWPASGRAMYVDYDDIAIYNRDPGKRDEAGNPWIGPVNGSSSTPKPPSDLGF